MTAESDVMLEIVAINYSDALRNYEAARTAWADHFKTQPPFDELEWLWETGAYGEWDKRNSELRNELIAAGNALFSMRVLFQPRSDTHESR